MGKELVKLGRNLPAEIGSGAIPAIVLLAQSHLKNLCLEALIECVEEHYTVDVKKTFGQKASKKSSSKSKKRS